MEDTDFSGRRGFFWKTWILLEDMDSSGRHGFSRKIWDSMEDWIFRKTWRLSGRHAFSGRSGCLEDLDIVGRLAVAGRPGDVGRP